MSSDFILNSVTGVAADDVFWKKVDRSGGPNSCWPWTAATNGRYGLIRINNKNIRAHRKAFSLRVGEIPFGYEVCHKCDNPVCCNPEHLFVGTHRDNMDDRNRKKRYGNSRGEKNGFAKLSDNQVVALKILSLSGWRCATLSVFFGICKAHVYKILSGKARVSVLEK